MDLTVREFIAGQTIFNRYELINVLGRGGMGIVWLARDTQLERDVALKFLSEMIIHDPTVIADLKRETRRSLELTHPHIVRIHDFVQDKDCACISMEYVDGDTLSGLRDAKLSKVFEAPELGTWLKQWCEAMDYAHQFARVVHCDLKPANLMVNSRGLLKITDFGIARSLSESATRLTTARGHSGTLVYMSPQQLNGERPSHLDDIYSMGASLYELLTSKPPFYRGQIDQQIREKHPIPMAIRRDELDIRSAFIVPHMWEETVAACLAKNPARRPRTASEIVERLQLNRVIEPRPQPKPVSKSTVTVKARRTVKGVASPITEFPHIASIILRPSYTASKKFFRTNLRDPVLYTLAAICILVIGAALWYLSITRSPQEARNSIVPASPNLDSREFAKFAKKLREQDLSKLPTPSADVGTPAEAATAASQESLPVQPAKEVDQNTAPAASPVRVSPGPNYSWTVEKGWKLKGSSDVQAPRGSSAASPTESVSSSTDNRVWQAWIGEFVKNFVSANQLQDVDANLGFYAPNVDYFDDHQRDQTYLRTDIARYNERWPVRHDSIEGGVHLQEKAADQEYAANFKLNFYAESASRKLWTKGQFDVDLEIRVIDGAPKILGIKEKVLQQQRGKLTTTLPNKPTSVQSYPSGIAVPSKPGFVKSPYAPSKGYIDIRRFRKGAEVKCPFTGKIFLVP